jgi:hypothetical protein
MLDERSERERTEAGESSPLPPIPLGSRARGPDERAIAAPTPAVAAPSAEPYARQAALAIERQAVRVRRFRLRTASDLESGGAAAAPAAGVPPPPPAPGAPGALLGAIMSSLIATMVRRAMRRTTTSEHEHMSKP